MHQFIQDAVKGGYDIGWIVENLEIILDPKAWEAVGKTRGWRYEKMYSRPCDEWKDKMHTFLDHLIDGLSIEEALNKIK